MTWLKSPLRLFFSIFILTGLVLRFYNLNYDNLWFDETATFWVSDPSINFSEVLSRNIQIEGSLFIYNFLVYFFNKLAGYDPFNIRIYAAIFGTLSIVVFFFLSKNILKSHDACFFATSLFSLNIYLIKYCHQGRMYSFLVLMCLLAIFFMIKILKEEKQKKIFNKYLFFFLIFQTIASVTSPFASIIVGSFLFILFLRLLFGEKNLTLFLIVLVYVIFILFLYYFWSKDINYELKWIVNPGIKFFTNFYSSHFFGSRLLGIVHFLVLIGLIIKFRKLVFYKPNEKTLLIYLILFTYLIPLVFGYLFFPVIHERYIIFVLIPILILLSYFIFEINNIKLKNFLIILLLGMNFFNHFDESTFKQFYQDRPRYKPSFVEAVKYIENTDTKNYTFLLKSGPNDFNYTSSKPLFHYVNHIITKKNLSSKGQTFQNFLVSEEKKIWLISMNFPFAPYEDIINKNNLKLIKKIDFTMLQIIKLEK